MCLTIPKKVVEVKKDSVILETADGNRQEVKSMVGLSVGDYVFTQQNIVIEKMEKQNAEEILKILNKGGDTPHVNN